MVGRRGGRPIPETGKIGASYDGLEVGGHSRPAGSSRGGGGPMNGISKDREQLIRFRDLFSGYNQAHGIFEIERTDLKTGKRKVPIKQ